MTWVMIGVIGGSLVVSGHDSKEACEDRAAILREQKVVAKCTEAPGTGLALSGSGQFFSCINGVCR